MSEHLLHPGYLGDNLVRGLETAAANTKQAYIDAGQPSEPGITILVRTRNDAVYLPGLFEDIAAQDYTGEREVHILDACSSDRTLTVAREAAARIFDSTNVRIETVKRDDFANRAIDHGIREANQLYVMSLIGHSRLATNQAMRTATVHLLPDNDNRAVAAFGLSLPGAHASMAERFGAKRLGAHEIVAQGAVSVPADGKEMGVLAMDCTIIDAEIYKRLGGFDQGYEAGGADGKFAASLIASGLKVVRDPSLAVHHTHGLGPLQAGLQFQFWNSLSEPHDMGAAPGYDYCLDHDRRIR